MAHNEKKQPINNTNTNSGRPVTLRNSRDGASVVDTYATDILTKAKANKYINEAETAPGAQRERRRDTARPRHDSDDRLLSSASAPRRTSTRGVTSAHDDILKEAVSVSRPNTSSADSTDKSVAATAPHRFTPKTRSVTSLSAQSYQTRQSVETINLLAEKAGLSTKIEPNSSGNYSVKQIEGTLQKLAKQQGLSLDFKNFSESRLDAAAKAAGAGSDAAQIAGLARTIYQQKQSVQLPIKSLGDIEQAKVLPQTPPAAIEQPHAPVSVTMPDRYASEYRRDTASAATAKYEEPGSGTATQPAAATTPESYLRPSEATTALVAELNLAARDMGIANEVSLRPDGSASTNEIKELIQSITDGHASADVRPVSAEHIQNLQTRFEEGLRAPTEPARPQDISQNKRGAFVLAASEETAELVARANLAARAAGFEDRVKLQPDGSASSKEVANLIEKITGKNIVLDDSSGAESPAVQLGRHIENRRLTADAKLNVLPVNQPSDTNTRPSDSASAAAESKQQEAQRAIEDEKRRLEDERRRREEDIRRIDEEKRRLEDERRRQEDERRAAGARAESEKRHLEETRRQKENELYRRSNMPDDLGVGRGEVVFSPVHEENRNVTMAQQILIWQYASQAQLSDVFSSGAVSQYNAYGAHVESSGRRMRHNLIGTANAIAPEEFRQRSDTILGEFNGVVDDDVKISQIKWSSKKSTDSAHSAVAKAWARHGTGEDIAKMSTDQIKALRDAAGDATTKNILSLEVQLREAPNAHRSQASLHSANADLLKKYNAGANAFAISGIDWNSKSSRQAAMAQVSAYASDLGISEDISRVSRAQIRSMLHTASTQEEINVLLMADALKDSPKWSNRELGTLLNDTGVKTAAPIDFNNIESLNEIHDAIRQHYEGKGMASDQNYANKSRRELKRTLKNDKSLTKEERFHIETLIGVKKQKLNIEKTAARTGGATPEQKAARRQSELKRARAAALGAAHAAGQFVATPLTSGITDTDVGAARKTVHMYTAPFLHIFRAPTNRGAVRHQATKARGRVLGSAEAVTGTLLAKNSEQIQKFNAIAEQFGTKKIKSLDWNNAASIRKSRKRISELGSAMGLGEKLGYMSTGDLKKLLSKTTNSEARTVIQLAITTRGSPKKSGSFIEDSLRASGINLSGPVNFNKMSSMNDIRSSIQSFYNSKGMVGKNNLANMSNRDLRKILNDSKSSSDLKLHARAMLEANKQRSRLGQLRIKGVSSKLRGAASTYITYMGGTDSAVGLRMVMSASQVVQKALVAAYKTGRVATWAGQKTFRFTASFTKKGRARLDKHDKKVAAKQEAKKQKKKDKTEAKNKRKSARKDRRKAKRNKRIDRLKNTKLGRSKAARKLVAFGKKHLARGRSATSAATALLKKIGAKIGSIFSGIGAIKAVASKIMFYVLAIIGVLFLILSLLSGFSQVVANVIQKPSIQWVTKLLFGFNDDDELTEDIYVPVEELDRGGQQEKLSVFKEVYKILSEKENGTADDPETEDVDESDPDSGWYAKLFKLRNEKTKEFKPTSEDQVFSNGYYKGFYNPYKTSDNGIAEIKEFGVRSGYTPENKYVDGVTYTYFQELVDRTNPFYSIDDESTYGKKSGITSSEVSPDVISAKQKNILLIMSLADGFFSGDLESGMFIDGTSAYSFIKAGFTTTSRLKAYKEFCEKLWDASHVYSAQVTTPYVCKYGDVAAIYYCNYGNTADMTVDLYAHQNDPDGALEVIMGDALIDDLDNDGEYDIARTTPGGSLYQDDQDITHHGVNDRYQYLQQDNPDTADREYSALVKQFTGASATRNACAVIWYKSKNHTGADYSNGYRMIASYNGDAAPALATSDYLNSNSTTVRLNAGEYDDRKVCADPNGKDKALNQQTVSTLKQAQSTTNGTKYEKDSNLTLNSHAYLLKDVHGGSFIKSKYCDDECFTTENWTNSTALSGYDAKAYCTAASFGSCANQITYTVAMKQADLQTVRNKPTVNGQVPSGMSVAVSGATLVMTTNKHNAPSPETVNSLLVDRNAKQTARNQALTTLETKQAELTAAQTNLAQKQAERAAALAAYLEVHNTVETARDNYNTYVQQYNNLVTPWQNTQTSRNNAWNQLHSAEAAYQAATSARDAYYNGAFMSAYNAVNNAANAYNANPTPANAQAYEAAVAAYNAAQQTLNSYEANVTNASTAYGIAYTQYVNANTAFESVDAYLQAAKDGYEYWGGIYEANRPAELSLYNAYLAANSAAEAASTALTAAQAAYTNAQTAYNNAQAAYNAAAAAYTTAVNEVTAAKNAAWNDYAGGLHPFLSNVFQPALNTYFAEVGNLASLTVSTITPATQSVATYQYEAGGYKLTFTVTFTAPEKICGGHHITYSCRGHYFCPGHGAILCTGHVDLDTYPAIVTYTTSSSDYGMLSDDPDELQRKEKEAFLEEYHAAQSGDSYLLNSVQPNGLAKNLSHHELYLDIAAIEKAIVSGGAAGWADDPSKNLLNFKDNDRDSDENKALEKFYKFYIQTWNKLHGNSNSSGEDAHEDGYEFTALNAAISSKVSGCPGSVYEWKYTFNDSTDISAPLTDSSITQSTHAWNDDMRIAASEMYNYFLNSTDELFNKNDLQASLSASQKDDLLVNTFTTTHLDGTAQTAEEQWREKIGLRVLDSVGKIPYYPRSYSIVGKTSGYKPELLYDVKDCPFGELLRRDDYFTTPIAFCDPSADPEKMNYQYTNFGLSQGDWLEWTFIQQPASPLTPITLDEHRATLHGAAISDPNSDLQTGDIIKIVLPPGSSRQEENESGVNTLLVRYQIFLGWTKPVASSDDPDAVSDPTKRRMIVADMYIANFNTMQLPDEVYNLYENVQLKTVDNPVVYSDSMPGHQITYLNSSGLMS